jgi:hypothetical protein
MDPENEAYYLGLNMDGKAYRFGLLNTSGGGMGMLVRQEETDVLKGLKIGDAQEMEYMTPEKAEAFTLMIRHITPIHSGTYSGHYQVGLAF